ncbi:hypothetical protein JC525_07295 [Alteromonas sp. IB21]|uniref:hypothetical protein n=1 Tax=Alteromonas sp. IB21 TaxID=2779369 RepID=UPI0018E90778|nr:hypothetical protein [Alteromonas sp. IB21]MBJ2128739.1 hypothetical protein [Alteromonas sp. IB21]
MRNLFPALKQDTQASHTALENTFPFSIYHHKHRFNKTAYCAVLSIMKEFHQTSADVIKQARDTDVTLAQIVTMIDSKTVLTAISEDIHTLEAKSQLLSETHDALYIDTHPLYIDTHANYKDTHVNSSFSPTFNSPTTSAIAAIYVWLGSSMGANIIARRLNEMEQAIPTHYYQAMSECAKSWVSFKQNVDAFLPELALNNENVVDDIVQDANAWFEYLINLGVQFQAKPSSNNVRVDPL